MSYSPSFDLVVDPALAGGNDIIDNLLNLRARGGYAANRALFYGALGYSRGDMTVNGVREDANLSGMSASIGMDYLITDKIIAGLDYTRHNLDGTVDSLGGELKSDVQIISLRIGFKF